MADGVADSSDWLETPLPGLSSVEVALRCQVCKDFYNTPMTTECSHTFCSQCIRRALLNDGKCPICRSHQEATKLRNSMPLGDAAEAFRCIRSSVLDFARTTSELILPASPRQQAHVPEDTNKRPRTSARIRRLRDSESSTSMAGQMEVEEGTLPKLSDGCADDIEGKEDGSYGPNDGLVACPICFQRMKEMAVSQHLDTTCQGKAQPKSQSKAAPTPSLPVFGSLSTHAPTQCLERLPVIHYSLLKDSALRKKLNELGIPSHGPRHIVEKRHKEWMTIWNANCDSNRPKKRPELLRCLGIWDRTQGALAPTSSAAVVGNKVKDREFDVAAWSDKHSDEFRGLIANAKRSREGGKHTEIIGGGSSLVGDVQTHVDGPITKPGREDGPTKDHCNPPYSRRERKDNAHLHDAQAKHGTCEPMLLSPIDNSLPPVRGDGFVPQLNPTLDGSPVVASERAPGNTANPD